MSQIHLVRPHHGDRGEARAALDEAAQHIAERYGIHYEWDGDALRFSRTGVEGIMRIGEADVEIDVRLGFMLTMLRGPIQREIELELDRHLG